LAKGVKVAFIEEHSAIIISERHKYSPDFPKGKSFHYTGNIWGKEDEMVTSVACIQKFREEFRFRLAAETINRYELAVKQLLNCCKKSFDEITARDIWSWMLHLDSSGYKAVTVKTSLD
jgi:hypothetical protein